MVLYRHGQGYQNTKPASKGISIQLHLLVRPCRDMGYMRKHPLCVRTEYRRVLRYEPVPQERLQRPEPRNVLLHIDLSSRGTRWPAGMEHDFDSYAYVYGRK